MSRVLKGRKGWQLGAAALLFGLLFATNVSAQAGGDVSLCLSLDGSGSLSSTDFDLQIDGYASAIESSAIVPRDGTVSFAVVQFSSSVVTEVPLTTVDSEAAATQLAADIRAINFQNGPATATGTAIEECVTLLDGAPGRRIIDISTDGGSNQGTNPPQAADDAIAAGIDAINLLGVGAGVDQAELDATARPQPASTLPEPGFVLVVDDFADFEPAIAAKIEAEITGGGPATPIAVPTFSPAGLVLLILVMLLSYGVVVRRGM
jgi:hypothetical protein